MQPEPEYETKKSGCKKLIGRVAILLFAAIVLAVFLIYTPPGLLGKADAVGYAVCHRIASRSFFLGDRQLPLCIRCTGMHLGALIGFLYQLNYGKRGSLPAKKFMVIFGLFFAAFAFDGFNSYLHLFPNAPTVYESMNWLRLLTGMGLGLGIAGILYPTFNQTIWTDWEDAPIFHNWRQALELLLLAAVFYLLTLSENVLILYPVAVLTSLNVLVILAMIYIIVWVLIFKRENCFLNFKQLTLYIVAGFTTAILQILIMDYARYNITGTWNGFF